MIMYREAIPHQNEAASAQELAVFFEQNEALQDPEQRRDYFVRLEPEDFIYMVQRTNNAIRGGTINGTQHFDGSLAHLDDWDVPDQEDKERLLLEVWTGARDILNDPQLTTDRALRYAALLAAGGINLAHPFKDSNGRTARTMAYLIDTGVNDEIESDMTVLLGREGGAYMELISSPVVPYVDAATSSSVPNKYDRTFPELRGILFRQHDIATQSDVIPGMIRRTFRRYMANDFAKLVDDEGHRVIQNHITDEGILHFGDAVLELSQGEKGIEYMAQLREVERYARANFVQRFIEAMKSIEGVQLIGDDQGLVERMRGEHPPRYQPTKRHGELLLAFAADDNTIQPRQAYDAHFESHSTRYNPY